MSDSQSKKTNKKLRKYGTRFICELLSNMNFRDRIRFVFTGNYHRPLQETLKNLKTDL